MASATEPKAENPSKTPDQQQQLPQPPPSTSDTDSLTKDGGESKISATEAAANSTALKDSNDDNKQKDEEDPAVSNIQRKIRRAERFGMPVQLSEEEKRNSRAQRFGIGSTVHGSDALKKSEEQKRKARAERFGIVQSEPVDEAAKKKARLARFGAATKTDPLEEDKKKARAIRFSQPKSGSLSQVNGKGNNIEMVKDSYCGQGWRGNLNIVASFFYMFRVLTFCDSPGSFRSHVYFLNYELLDAAFFHSWITSHEVWQHEEAFAYLRYIYLSGEALDNQQLLSVNLSEMTD
ncbi:unnamed protein product [Camellia sinensis]